MKTPWFAPMLGIVLCACVATTPRIEEGRIREARAGVTSYTDIVKRFGTASLVSRNPDGTSFATYVYSDPEAGAKELVPLVAGVFRDSVTFHFDARGLLTDVKTTSRTGDQETLTVTAERSPDASAKASGAVAAGSPAATPAARRKPSGFLWRLPDWLPAAPRENR